MGERNKKWAGIGGWTRFKRQAWLGAVILITALKRTTLIYRTVDFIPCARTVDFHFFARAKGTLLAENSIPSEAANKETYYKHIERERRMTLWPDFLPRDCYIAIFGTLSVFIFVEPSFFSTRLELVILNILGLDIF